MNFFFSLPFKNIAAGRTRFLSLMFFSAVLSAAVFGGFLAVKSLKNGLESLEKRLGADIIVVPYQTRTKESVENLLLNGNRTSFYMPKKYMEEISKYDGIEKITPQLFLSSISAGCCSVRVQIIGFEPETDFLIQPWAFESYKGKLNDFEILAGSKITVPENRILSFFNTNLKVASKLKETGSGLDNAVYCNMNTVKALIRQASKNSASPTGKINADSLVSTVLIKVQDGYDASTVMNEINLHMRKIRAVKSKSMTSDIADSLSKISRISGILIFAVWCLCTAIMMIVFSMIQNERKKEFAVLRIAGVTRKKIAGIVIFESLIINFAGGILGALFVLSVALPFKTAIQNSFSMPFLIPDALETAFLFILSLFASVFAGTFSSVLAAKKVSLQDASLILRDAN